MKAPTVESTLELSQSEDEPLNLPNRERALKQHRPPVYTAPKTLKSHPLKLGLGLRSWWFKGLGFQGFEFQHLGLKVWGLKVSGFKAVDPRRA